MLGESEEGDMPAWRWICESFAGASAHGLQGLDHLRVNPSSYKFDPGKDLRYVLDSAETLQPLNDIRTPQFLCFGGLISPVQMIRVS